MSRLVRHGFLLLEAAVALLIIGLTAGAVLELRGAQLRALQRTPGMLAAVALAQDRLAAVRLLDPEQLSHVPDSLARGRFAPPFSDYRWRASISRSGIESLYDARVEVTWSDGAFALASRIYAPSPGSGR